MLERQMQTALDTYSKITVSLTRVCSAKFTPGQRRSGLAKLKEKKHRLEGEIDGLRNELAGLLQSKEACKGGRDRQRVQRFEELLGTIDYDYRTAKEAMANALIRVELLTGQEAPRPTQRGKAESLLAEQMSLDSSLKSTDEAIAKAQDAKASIQRQGKLFAETRGKLGLMGEHFPHIASLISRIQSHRQRDSFILALVVGSCMFFTVTYWLNKP